MLSALHVKIPHLPTLFSPNLSLPLSPLPFTLLLHSPHSSHPLRSPPLLHSSPFSSQRRAPSWAMLVAGSGGSDKRGRGRLWLRKRVMVAVGEVRAATVVGLGKRDPAGGDDGRGGSGTPSPSHADAVAATYPTCMDPLVATTGGEDMCALPPAWIMLPL